jgi:hypothetical protein
LTLPLATDKFHHTMQAKYDERYFRYGKEDGVSNYTDYQWLEERTMAFASRLIDVMQMPPRSTFLDFGAARGYTVKALRRMEIDAWGYDISKWAVENCDPEVNGFVHQSIQHDSYGFVMLKDVCEHLEVIELMRVADHLLKITKRCILIMVPLTEQVGGPYVRKEDDMDVTHNIRWPLGEWMKFFANRIPGESWSLQGSWHIPGLKPTSLSHPRSCGFISLRRVVS